MAKKYTKEQRNSYTSFMIILFLISLFVYLFFISYCLGIIFPELRFVNAQYSLKSDLYQNVLLSSLVLDMAIVFILCSSSIEMNTIFKGVKAGNIVDVVGKTLLIFEAVILLGGCFVSWFLKQNVLLYDSLSGILFSTLVFILSLMFLLAHISDPPGFPTALNVKYKIKHHNYNDFKRYLAEKLKISVSSFEMFEEKHCDIESYCYSKGDDEFCFVLIPLNKVDRKIIGDCFDGGFYDYFAYKYKDVDTKKKSFYVYFIFVVEEVNVAFKEMIKYRAPMQKNYYFVGVGIDTKNNELYINGYDKKKFKDNYELLFNKFDSLIEDIKIK